MTDTTRSRLSKRAIVVFVKAGRKAASDPIVAADAVVTSS